MIAGISYKVASSSNLKFLISNIANCSIQSVRFAKYNPYVHPNPLCQPRKTGKFQKKNPIPKFKAERGRKIHRPEIPDLTEYREDEMTPAEIRAKMKEKGIQPARPWNEKPVFIASTGTSVEPYVPPEGDGKASLVSKERAIQTYEFLEKKGKAKYSMRQIYRFEEDFYIKDFVEEAQKIYINLHEALMRGDEDELHKLATERAFPLVMNQTKNKIIKWAFHGSIEPPRAVHVRHVDILTKDNVFAQITVRFHTQQTLAVYDRFGRLIHGSETVLRDVLEYVVFEKHISNIYGLWRIHDKIIPSWMNFKPTSMNTFKISDPPQEEPKETPSSEEPVETESTQGQETEKILTPAT
ncbi:putative 39S ribosomal protein L45, mitochondrial [Armadillidium vulgare]|nr:putative 39S ribosomal protein L45, mitochondrial [Armadillidium vulgare]